VVQAALAGFVFEDTLHGGRRDAVPFSDLAGALAILPIVLDGEIIKHQRVAAHADASKPAPHPAVDPAEAVSIANHHTHIHNAPDNAPRQVDRGCADFNCTMSMYSLNGSTKAPDA